MPEPSRNPSATTVDSSTPRASSVANIPDLVETRRKWDDSLEASFAKIEEIMRECVPFPVLWFEAVQSLE